MIRNCNIRIRGRLLSVTSRSTFLFAHLDMYVYGAYNILHGDYFDGRVFALVDWATKSRARGTLSYPPNAFRRGPYPACARMMPICNSSLRRTIFGRIRNAQILVCRVDWGLQNPTSITRRII